MKITFMISEMAKLHNISRQTLIHYDHIGLFKPAEVHPETGYRLYTLEQSEDLYVILTLKALGMRLQEIKGYQKKMTTSERIALLEKKEEVLERKIEEAIFRKKRLAAIVSSLKSRQKITPFEMGVKRVRARNILVESVEEPRGILQLELAIKALIEKNSHTFPEGTMDPFVWVVQDQGAEFFTQVGVEVSFETGQRIASKEYGYIFHKGPYETIRHSRNRLIKHLVDQGYHPESSSIERVLLDALAVPHESDYLIEVWVPIENRQKAISP
ncbi:MAG: MerR family transcriptional regulator [Desulfobacterales bacterium]|nr:MerR family transcriptional regulator [Desulfobacterales bacterium]